MIEPGNLIAIFSLVVMAYRYRPVFTTHFPDLTLAFDSSWPPVLTLRGFQGVQPHDRNAPPVHTPPLAVSDLVTRVFLSRLTSRFKIKIRPPVQVDDCPPAGVDAVHLWR